ncbi:MAG: tetratricopeptide repeat protein [Bosea sp.]|uniref:tetratricopeptide repeat protein n=1 Tax=Bosea sp. (in: a-proteobacteria) TaxID=1871050 RepID=UPI0023A497BD|nr:tetratricopeptide repeat protein [Bosea sp. (in: a-proteobacteria)]MCP4735182.1 tetratricopeptide repeat protein [Bosea sp. (in: a-proteobacteria)]
MNAQAAATSHATRVRAGLKRLSEGRTDEAEAILREALATRPDDPWVLNGLGGAALRRRDTAAAERLIGAAARLLPGEPEILANLAALHTECDRLDDAETCLDQAVRFAPEHAGVRERRAELLLVQRRPSEAAIEAQQALECDPERPRAWLLRGLCALAASDRSLAIACFEEAVALDETCIEAWHNLAEAHAALGNEASAIDCAERAYLCAPSDPLHIVTLARLLAARDPGRSGELTRRALALAPGDLPALELQALAAADDAAARSAFAALAAAARGNGAEGGPALLALARALAGAGRFGDALLASERAAAMQLSEARSLRHACLFALGRFEDAYRDLPEPRQEIDAVLIPPDMPLGEVVFALRLLPALATQAGRELPLLAPAALHPLLAPLAPALTETNHATARPLVLAEAMAHLRADAGVLAMSAPYITVEPSRARLWQDAIAALPGPRIGIVWSAHLPGMGLQDLLAVARPLGTMVSLAMGAARDELLQAPDVIDAGHRIAGPEDLAAAIAALDLVLAPDCLALHLAGALGRPGIALLSRAPHWIWQEEAGQARFYPTLTPCRAKQASDATASRAELERLLRMHLTAEAEA